MFFSLGSKPLELWNKVVSVEGGEIKKVVDQDIQSSVFELTAPNTMIPKVYLACPADPSKSLGIKLRKPHFGCIFCRGILLEMESELFVRRMEISSLDFLD